MGLNTSWIWGNLEHLRDILLPELAGMSMSCDESIHVAITMEKKHPINVDKNM